MNDSSKTAAVIRSTVGEESAGQRLDNFLLRVCRGVPKSHVYRIVRSGEVRVNGRRIDPSYRLCPGDEVRIPPIRTAVAPARSPVPPGTDVPVLFEDDALIAVDKPAGLAVHGGSGISFGLIELLRHRRPQARFLELVHRLDRETSGVILIAKRRSALTRLHQMLRAGDVRKRYLALVRGRWMEPERDIDLPLYKYLTAEGERRVSVRRDGSEARTRVLLRRRWANFSLLDVELLTGRTHQIRVHLAHLGFPLCGDDKYGDFDLNHTLRRVGLKRMFLHAARLGFAHPLTGAPLDLAAPLPRELAGFLDALDRNEPIDDVAAV